MADMGFAEEGKVPLLMHEVEVGDHIRDPDQRFVYAYDFLHMWMFLVERIAAAVRPRPHLSPCFHERGQGTGRAFAERPAEGGSVRRSKAEGPNDHYSEEEGDDEDDMYGGSVDDLGEEYQ